VLVELLVERVSRLTGGQFRIGLPVGTQGAEVTFRMPAQLHGKRPFARCLPALLAQVAELGSRPEPEAHRAVEESVAFVLDGRQ